VIEITNDFTVGAEPELVYRTLLDFERLGSCIPGASIGPAGTHPAEIAVRLGPIRLTYKGSVWLDDRDNGARRATMVADVREVRGQGTARAPMSMTVTGADAGSRVGTVTDVELSGRAAQMGAAIVTDVAQRLVGDMAANLERLLEGQADPAAPAPAKAAAAPPPQNRPVSGFGLLLRALWHRLWRARRRSVSETD
jgi:uncharacterized protein